jgi:hypothetical protein
MSVHVDADVAGPFGRRPKTVSMSNPNAYTAPRALKNWLVDSAL